MRFTIRFGVAAGMLMLAPLAANAATTSIPAQWVEVKAGPMFTVHAPAGTTFERVRTGDAFAGVFHGPGFELSVEFGYHRETFKPPETVQAPAIEKVIIDTKQATRAEGATGDPAHPFFTALHVPAVETDDFGPLSLIITGKADNDGRATVERIYDTIQFGFKN